jgi:2-oxoglutarate ferredoxin oxidoreductase subunit delta
MPDVNNCGTIFGDTPKTVLQWMEDQIGCECGKIVVARGWCKRCGVCMSSCPVKALEKDREGYPVVDNSRCTSCGTCEIMCPDFAIIVCGLKDRKAEKKQV